MKDDIRQQWTAALRSGEYKQGSSALHDESDGVHSYCCLGVLCDLAVKAGVKVEVEKRDGGVFYYDKDGSYLPDSVMDWAGLDTGNPQTPAGSCAHMNDGRGMSFAEIADVIDTHLKESADA